MPELNHEQRRAATWLWQNDAFALELVAGAGSGKTTTLVAAVIAAHQAGYAAEKLCVVTFTRKAAHELKARLSRSGITPGFCGTIHALAWRFLRESSNTPRLLLHPEKYKSAFLRQNFPQLAYLPEHLLTRRGFFGEAETKEIEHKWQQYLEQNQLADFDTLVPKASRLPAIQGRFDVIFVDEFQDISPEQLEFLLILQPKKFFVVGDDWQSIYRFRGADVSLTRDFLKLVPNAHRLFLLHNYRSSGRIVRLGNRTIKLSQSFVPKKLKATTRRGSAPIFFLSEGKSPQTLWQNFLSRYGDSLPRPLVILVRTNFLRRLLESHLPAGFSVLTIHKSKGLEFDNVVIFGIAENVIPHRDNDFDEEVRILYVALSRARSFLGFLGWQDGGHYSPFLPFLLRHCRLRYF